MKEFESRTGKEEGMNTNTDQIRDWTTLNENEKQYMVILCDTFDYTDFPVFCDASECVERLNNPGGMNKVMEVYDLKEDFEAQLKECRAYHPPAAEREKK